MFLVFLVSLLVSFILIGVYYTLLLRRANGKKLPDTTFFKLHTLFSELVDPKHCTERKLEEFISLLEQVARKTTSLSRFQVFDQFKTNTEGNNLFLHFCSKGEYKKLRALLSSSIGAKDILLKSRNHHSLTALHFACHSGNIDLVKILCQAASKMKVEEEFFSLKTHEEFNALHLACATGRNQVVDFLLEQSEMEDRKEEKDKSGNNCL